MSTDDLTVKALGKWLLSHLPSLVILSTLLSGFTYVVVAPSVASIIRDGAPGVIQECFDKPDFDLGQGSSFQGQCAKIVEQVAAIVVAEAVTERFTKLEDAVEQAGTIARENQMTLKEFVKMQQEAQKARAKETEEIKNLIKSLK